MEACEIIYEKGSDNARKTVSIYAHQSIKTHYLKKIMRYNHQQNTQDLERRSHLRVGVESQNNQ